ncbi:deoxyribose-phosphate aldolase [Desulfolucanica intricata]|uniref:deoxyribose-phosphate aldolase n=1 Tax=Desulfolucanica intricata TaxID=1285191 RepID=UPI0008302F10|nr:deoxyribose-phosphate aldolase [Desulfolucanica intricata]
MIITKENLAARIDHTILKPTATQEDIISLCTEAKENGFASVCVNPFFVPLAAEQLKASKVSVCTVIGFPLGSSTTASKAFEAEEAVKNGAKEVDMVINISALKEGNKDVVLKDISAVVEATRSVNPTAITKVIIETCYLNQEEKKLAYELAKQAGAHFVKSSTGFGTGGAKVEDITLMRKIVGQDMGVKASGGIKTAGEALKMIKAGADRIGTSAGVNIINGI